MRYDMKYKKLNVEDNESCNLQCEKKCEKLAGVFICCILAFFLLFLSTRNVGLIYQFYNLIPVLSVKENILLPAELDNRKIDKEYLEDLLKTLDLKERENHLPSELSGGELQRYSVLRSLNPKTKFLIADEMTTMLDAVTQVQILDSVIKIIKKRKMGLLIVSHDLDLIDTICDDKIYLKDINNI